MAILRGEEARKWLEANPNRRYTDVNTGTVYNEPTQQSSPQRPGALNLILGLTQPFRQGVGILGEFGGTISDLVKTAQGKESEVGDDIFRQLGSIYLTEEEKKQLKEDPLKMGLKSGVGVASYGVPGGASKGVTGLKAIGQAAGKGALAGTMGGFGYSKEGQELESTLKGGALGGVLGGGLQAISEGVGALAGRGAKTYNTSSLDDINNLPKRLKSSYTNQAKAAGMWDKTGVSDAENIRSFLKNRGLAGNYPEETLLKMAQQYDDAVANKVGALEQMGDVSDDIFSKAYADLDEVAIKSGVDMKNTKAWKQVTDKLLKPKTKAMKDIDGWIMEWEKLGRSRGGEIKNTIDADVFTAAAKALRGTVRNSPGGAAYDESLGQLYQVLDLRDTGAVAKAAQSQATAQLKPPFTAKIGASLEGPSQKVSQAQAALGRLQEGGGIGLGGGITDAIQGAAGIGQRAIPGIAGLGGTQQAGPMGALQTPVPTQTQQPGIDKNMLAQMVMSGQLSAADANFLLQLYGGEEVEDADTIANIQQALGLIDQYGGKVAGKVSTIGGKTGEFFGAATPGTEYRALISDIRTKLIKQIAGTAQTPAEMKNLTDRLPQPTDEPAVAKAKLTVLLNSLQGGGTSGVSDQELSDQYINY